ncbi:MAG: carboxypeptidase regulatory-like domain-containing protein [Bryobacterales bacterium]|nr:carboxypeptidase regulatory-like domain-containing protein [Bryobacterales bacterium]
MLGAVLTAWLWFAQVGSPPVATVELAGRAVHFKTREALRKTQVTLAPFNAKGKETRVIITDSEGRFLFRDVPPGRYLLTGMRAGFILGRLGTPSQPLELKEGRSVRDIELALTPQSVLAGRVIDHDGDPVPNAQIVALQMSTRTGYREVINAANTITNDIGEFRIPGLYAGRYLLIANYRREPTAPEDQFLMVSGEDYAPTYYPNASTSGAATPIDVVTGEDSLNHVIKMRRLPVFRISGRINGSRERQGLRLYLVSDDNEAMRAGFAFQQMATLQAPDGFTFPGVVPGPYQVIAIRGGKQTVTVARQPVTVGYHGIDDLGVTLLEPVEIAGRLRVEGNASVNLSKVSVRLQPTEALLPNAIEMQVSKENRFEAEAASRERFLLLLRNLPENVYVHSIRVANQEAITAGVDLTYAPPLTQVDVVLRANPGSVEGVVHEGGNAAPSRLVTIAPDPAEPNQPWRTQEATSDEFGRFRFAGLAPGNYRVTSGAERHSPQSVAVSVSEGTTEHVAVNAVEEP